MSNSNREGKGHNYEMKEALCQTARLQGVRRLSYSRIPGNSVTFIFNLYLYFNRYIYLNLYLFLTSVSAGQHAVKETIPAPPPEPP